MKSCSNLFRSTPLALAALFVAAVAFGRSLDRTVVTINDEVILESDVEKFGKKLKSKSFQELFGGVDPKVIANRESVLQLMVEERIINQQVKKLDLQASPQEIDGQIRAILKRNNITEKQLGDRLKQLGSTIDEYREGIKRQVERRNLVEREIRPTLEISEEQLRHYYQGKAKSESAEVQYKIAHILVQPKAGDWKQATDRAQKVFAEVSKNPDQFEKIAKDASDDTSTK